MVFLVAIVLGRARCAARPLWSDLAVLQSEPIDEEGDDVGMCCEGRAWSITWTQHILFI
jgi:hypothetical protein